MTDSIMLRLVIVLLAATSSLAGCCAVGPRTELDDQALPSWREGESRTAIIDFVRRTTRAESPDFVPPADRIAVFLDLYLDDSMNLNTAESMRTPAPKLRPTSKLKGTLHTHQRQPGMRVKVSRRTGSSTPERCSRQLAWSL